MRDQSPDWTRLDNAAKIFPPTSNKQDTKVFRFACQLNEWVEQNILQQATEKTLETFPIFRSVLKHGLFWYYLEKTELVPDTSDAGPEAAFHACAFSGIPPALRADL